MWDRRRNERDRRARIALLSDEADKQREIAAGRLNSTMTKASLLLVGAGLIAGSWAVDLIGQPFGVLPAAALVLALGAVAAAVVSLFPRSSLKLKVRDLVERSLATNVPAQTVPDLEDLLLETKAAVTESIDRENSSRDLWVRIGYALLLAAIAGGAASLVAALLIPST
ncbi:hypothetical protein [Agromyces sp. ZXT2-6]|uniref:hypothetical protein n=1 Tax=Agromyces sp. ZXT2-6 TaxID=3461153 RepID=UPI0040551E91